MDFDADWSYSPAPQSSAEVKLRKRYDMFIDGEFRPAESGEFFESINPATEEKLTEVSQAGADDVERAVAAARQAYTGTWSRMPAAERGKFLFRIARMIQERSRELAVMESMDGGKPIREARDIDIPRAQRAAYRRGRTDNTLELPTVNGCVEAGSSTRHRKHTGAQTGRNYATHGPVARGDSARG
jgi:acyl-CoA reductase-like NAD-dependent aldehyde dehydrogenase